MSVIVIGAGAAGLGAAHFAARKGVKATVLERNLEAGKKILLSGGTRCNILPVYCNIDSDYFSNSHSALIQEVFRTWDLDSCRSWIEDSLGIPLVVEEETNKYFPKSNSAKEVRDALVQSCLEMDVEIQLGASVKRLKPIKDGWQCTTTDGRMFYAERVVLASGGKSYPKIGTDGTGFEILKKLGHTIVEPYPALTPLHAPHPGGVQLAGISLQSVDLQIVDRAKSSYKSDRSGLLFTHKGYSGPGILDMSHFFTKAETENEIPTVAINWLTEDEDVWEERFVDRKWRGTIANYIQRFGIPRRLADALIKSARISESKLLSQLTKQERVKLTELLTSYPLAYTGHGGYKLAEVTGGGVPFEQIDSKTMESTSAQGLYICGELMDIFGRIGGFNFYWAWLSGRLAGISVSHFI